MNNLQFVNQESYVSNEILNIKGIHGYLDKSNVAYLDLEDVARGLGFTRIATSGNKVVRWETVRKYLAEFGVPTSWHENDKIELSSKIKQIGKDGLPEFIPENIFYKLCFKANNKIAIDFQNVVTDEVLPSIRKCGMYVTEELLDNPEFAAKVFMTLHEERQQRIAAEQRVGVLEEKIELDMPLVNFATAVSASNESIPVGDFAKLLKQNGVDIGRNRMLEWLRSNGYLIKAGASKNLPTQRYMNSGLFEIHESGYYDNGGNWQIVLTTFITGKGQKYFFDKFFAQIGA